MVASVKISRSSRISDIFKILLLEYFTMYFQDTFWSILFWYLQGMFSKR